MGMTNESLQLITNILIIVTIFSLINYVFVSLALYKIAKKEKIDNPWLTWIPVGNAYILINVGKGNVIFIFPLIVAMFTTGIIVPIGMAVYTAYSIYMYYKICQRYNVSVIPIAIGALSLVISIIPQLTLFAVPVYLISIYGQWKLFKGASKEPVNDKRKIKAKLNLNKAK